MQEKEKIVKTMARNKTSPIKIGQRASPKKALGQTPKHTTLTNANKLASILIKKFMFRHSYETNVLIFDKIPRIWNY